VRKGGGRKKVPMPRKNALQKTEENILMTVIGLKLATSSNVKTVQNITRI